ncbi:uncharacterized protein LOC128850989 [Cuculus canorus]|uniref:uncharacterized protein LOC128850989 n=1 Tax=Cuculus canorus TaxID=55661 RepID=UPI0023AAF61A|nr:uncharacterized protein LOC128850989 [Cuculus canorus]
MDQTFDKCNASKIDTPKRLPRGIFLICGDRAWNGIPAQPQGGPCYLGKLSLFHPNISLIMQWSQNTSRKERSVHELDCSSLGPMRFWSEFRQVATAVILPGAAARKALRLIEQLGCWAKDELNTTSQILDMLTSDVQSVNHAVLQNRAAIDFLLLAQGHGCEEFEGMCCMNLTDHSTSIHAKLRKLQQGLHQLKQEDGRGIDTWLQSMFGPLSPWLLSVIKEILRGAGLVLLVIIAFKISYHCIMQSLAKNHTALLVQKEKGGNVGKWLNEEGHEDVEKGIEEWLDEQRHGSVD